MHQPIPWNYAVAIALIFGALLVVGLSLMATIHAARAQKYNSILHGVMRLLVFAVVIIGVSILINIKELRMSLASGEFSIQTVKSAEKNSIDTTLVSRQETQRDFSQKSSKSKESNELLDLLTR